MSAYFRSYPKLPSHYQCNTTIGFKEIVSSELNLSGSINQYKTCALNIFSGPLTITNSIPREKPYYKIVQESDLGTMLYDYSSENTYSKDLATSLSEVFNAEDWQEHIEMPKPKEIFNGKIEIDLNAEKSILAFLRSRKSGVLILESMDSGDRDNWVRYILSQSQEFEIPQVETWIHSARISRKISARIGMEIQSLYNTIYGGSPSFWNIEDAAKSEKEQQDEEQQQEVIPIRSADSIDESAVIILHEAHLVSRSLHQSELLRFGTGRLLEDLFTFLNLAETKRKLICIGDPYSLTYGKEIDSAINKYAIEDIFLGETINYRKPLVPNNFSGKLSLRLGLASAIENNLFNNLSYPWQSDDLEEVSENQISNYLFSWFNRSLESEPEKVVMVYSNKHAYKINLLIKNQILENGNELSQNDILIIHNNITIPNYTGFGQPSKLYKRMFLLVNAVGETVSRSIVIKQNEKPVILTFTKVHVTCLSLPNKLETSIYLLKNYFSSEDGLSKDEKIAFRVFINQLINRKMKEEPFENSKEFNQMRQDNDYRNALDNEAILKEEYHSGKKVKTKLDVQQRELRKIEKTYKRNFRNRLFLNIIQTDPLSNAAHVQYGWALTVHKCIGSSFSEVIIDVNRGVNRGIDNEDYYRWLYSGVTATINTLLVINSQTINPLMETQFEDISIISPLVESPKKKLLSFLDYEVSERFKPKISSELRESVCGAICELSKRLEQHGFLLESIYPASDYLTKVNYSIPLNSGKSLILTINNKGQKDNWNVSSIRIEQATEEIKNLISQEIDRLFSHHSISKSSSISDLPDDFRMSTYQIWQTTLRKKGYDLILTETHRNQDVFLVKNSSDDFAKFCVWYRNKGFFSKVVILQKSIPELGENLREWLLNENQT